MKCNRTILKDHPLFWSMTKAADAMYRIQMSPDSGEGTSAVSDDVVTISRVELDALRAQAGTATDGSDRDASHAQELAAREQRVTELERAYRSALRDRELATALTGKPLVPGAAAQLIKLWREDFDAYEESGEYRVGSRDGRTIQQAIADRLASAEYAHFCLPSSRGGSGAQDTNRVARLPHGGAPKTLGEAVVMQWREQAATRAGGASKPIGLGRRR